MSDDWLKNHYPCPVCFIKGRVNSGVIKEGDFGIMVHVTEKDVTVHRLWYKCKCGALLETREEAEQKQ